MNRILVVAHSYYMLMAAIQIKRRIYFNETVDLLLSNSSRGNKDILQRIKQESIFNNCYFYEDSILYPAKSNVIARLNSILCGVIKPEKIISKAGMDFIDFNYDKLICYSELRISEQIVFNRIINVNQSAICELYEEGVASYLHKDGVFSINESRSVRIFQNLMKVFKPNNILNKHVKIAWFFRPDLVQYTTPYRIGAIPLFDIEMISILNNIFNYNFGDCLYECDYLYLEDAGYANGVETDDKTIIEDVIGIITANHKKIAVKLHPRSPQNRFQNSNISVITENAPIELMMLNCKRKLTLITISSHSPIACMSILPNQFDIIMLYKCSAFSQNGVDSEEFERYISTIKKSSLGINIFIPNEISEISKIIECG